MKKLYAFSLAILLAAGLTAQNKTEITGMKSKELHPVFSASNKINTADTISDYLDRATAFYILTAGADGYVLGTSDVTTETGQHYDAIGNGLVNELMVYFVHKEIIGTADDISVKVYSVGADSLPTTLQGTGTINMADADTTGFPSYIAITGTSYNSNAFFVSVEYGQVDDTVALFSTNPTTTSGGPDGANERRCGQFVGTLGAWDQAADIWTIGGVPYNADALILPILDVTPAGIGPATTSEFALFGAYPNPASSSTTIRYSLEKSHNIKITVFDNTGRIMGEMPSSQKSVGQNELVINVNNYPAGKYYYTISSDNTSITSKFVVVK